jgi:phosphoenolpyruvate carboxykinase (GTP)
VAAAQCPTYSPHANDPQGVPISAIIFGGRRAAVAPLVYEAFDWEHGVFVGASCASETTAAATGEVGKVRRDPMAMKPFCGYNFGEYWEHWLSFAAKSESLPKVFHVNWFRKDAQGRFMWPGFGDNMRVLKWVVDRCHNQAPATRSAIGYLPEADTLDLRGLDIDPATLQELLAVDPKLWKAEIEHVDQYFGQFEPAIPRALREQTQRIGKALES